MNILQVDQTKVPPLYLNLIAVIRQREERITRQFLGSISAVVTSREGRQEAGEDMFSWTDEENSSEFETDDEDYDFVACKPRYFREVTLQDLKISTRYDGAR